MSTLIKTGRMILDALAFANVNNLGELRAQLHQLDKPAGSQAESKQSRTAAAASNHYDGSPIIHHVQGAL